MPFRPSSLPYKLRRLFDAKICTPSDIARSVGMPVSKVDGWLRGREPDPVTRIQVDKILSFYTRRAQRHLKLEIEEVLPDTPEEPPRGVYEDPEAFPGTNAFNVYRSDGARIGRWEAPTGVTDEELLVAFEGLLERKDASRITMLPSSGEASS
jgi:hypothetical protein